MKKSLLFGFIGVGLLTLCSCEKEYTSSQTYNVSTYNYVTFLEDDAEPVIKKGSYTYSFDNVEGLVTISTDVVDLGDDNYSRFRTDAFKYRTSVVHFSGEPWTVLYGSNLTPGVDDNNMEIRNLRFELSPICYTPPTINFNPDPNYPNLDLTYKERPNGTSGFAAKMVYLLGDKYMVYTFWPDLYYNGVTRTEVNGVEGSSFESQDVGYRMKFDIKRKKVNVVLYNVQFNPQMPKMECLILPELDVQFTNNGYIVEAANVVPLYIEGEKLMENPRFPFTSFRFVAEGNMVEANCEFTVAGRFSGSFTGRYMEFVVR